MENLSSNNKIILKNEVSVINIFIVNNRLTNGCWDFVYDTDSTQLTFTRFQEVIDQHFEYNFKMQYFIINYKTVIIRKN